MPCIDRTEIELAGDLKRSLLDFVFSRPRLARELSRRLAGMAFDEERAINVTDHFVLQAVMPDGRTILEQFCASHRELTAREREIVLSWRDVVDSVFEVIDRDEDSLVALNIIDELTYRVMSNFGRSGLESIRTSDFLVARIVPWGDVWMLTGMSARFPAGDADVVLRAAAERATSHPELLFRNPDKLARAWEFQHQERDHFVAYFGTDDVVVAGAQAHPTWDAYWRWRLDRVPAQRRVGAPASFELPDELVDADTVALVYDELEGLVFLAEYGLVQAAFADSTLAASRPHREAVLGYLNDDSISARTMCRLAERDPDCASALFARLLRKPRFRWDRDGDALLRRRKPDCFRSPTVPKISPLGERLALSLRTA